MKNRWFLLWITAFVLIFVVRDALAIPAFARKYRFSCAVCHAPIPKLKEFGEEFAGNGFRLPGKEPRRFFLNVGDADLTLMRNLPVAVRFDAFLSSEPGKEINQDIKTPYGLKLLSGGQVYKSIGYYFYFYFSERGEVAGIEDAYLHFDNIVTLFGGPLDVMVGQFQVSDPLFKRELRLTYEDYYAYKFRLGMSRANLAYDRGITVTYSTPFGTDLAVEVVNGNGKGPASEESGAFDSDRYKNVFLRATQTIMGQRLGVFTYTGKERYLSDDNQFAYWGADATFTLHTVELNLQFLHREDNNPFYLKYNLSPIGRRKLVTRGGFAELIVRPTEKLFLIALYNRVYTQPGYLRYTTFTANATYWLYRNLKFLAEYTRDFESKSNRFVVGFTTGF